MGSDKPFLKLRDFAARINVSPNTIYRDPAKYHMFKVGGSWRANEESVEKFSIKSNNVTRLAVVGVKERKKCRSSKEVKSTGWTSQHQMEKELGALLAPRKGQKLRSTTTS